MGVLKVKVGSEWVDVTGGSSGGGVSADAGNELTEGTDAGAFFDGTIGTVSTAKVLEGNVDHFAHFTIHHDGTSTTNWPERLRFNFNDNVRTRRTGFFNEYGEMRSIAAKPNTTAMRVYSKEYVGDPARDMDAPVLEVANDRDTRTTLFAVYGDGDTLIYKDLTVNGAVVADNVGPNKVTSGTTAPSSPAIGDIWVDTN